jgi:hypothetical protein
MGGIEAGRGFNLLLHYSRLFRKKVTRRMEVNSGRQNNEIRISKSICPKTKTRHALIAGSKEIKPDEPDNGRSD